MIAEALKTSPDQTAYTDHARSGEKLYANARWQNVMPTLSVLVPTHNDAADALMARLSRCSGAATVEVIIYDDGSRACDLTSRIESAIDFFPGAACLVTAFENKGRSAARNRLEDMARSEWLLFLDADMIPDDLNFLVRYKDVISAHQEPMLIVGGFSLLQAPSDPTTDLHRAQSERSECLSAEVRNQKPGRYVFTSNVLAHKEIMIIVPFDPAFTGWGWEDVDWGIRASKRYQVLHIDNTATHLGLDTPASLMKKYGQSAANFWLAAERHPDVMKNTPLYKMADTFSRIPGSRLVSAASRIIAVLPGWAMPVGLRLLALKIFRAARYGSERHAG